MTPEIAVVDHGAGNLRSITRALEAAGARPVITTDPATIRAADGIVLPGVGAACAAMTRLDDLGLTGLLRERVASGAPFLGICLGMQLLFGHQEEGDTEGLGVLRGRVRMLAPGVKIPQIGWNAVRATGDGPLGPAGTEDDFYFVHSYVVDGADPADVAGVTRYGEAFPSVVARGHVWGTQFHPEKSSGAGLNLVRAWVEMVRDTVSAKAGAA
ncbi:MAG: imidazole glycerol phosphate synthase subunit HisH [Chloroflexota bacterium]